jgi:iron(III) transport system permease protein
MAMVQTVALSLVALGGLWFLRVVRGRPGLEDRREPLPSGGTSKVPAVRVAATVGGWVFAVLLLLPHLTLLLLSFVPIGTWTTQLLPPAYTTSNYTALFSEPERLRPLVNSLWMASGATLAALAIALAAGAARGPPAIAVSVPRSRLRSVSPG